MLEAKVIHVFRKTNNRIYGYRLQDTTGVIKDVTPEQLKAAMRNDKIYLSNYKLTRDNRIIQSKEGFKPDNVSSYLLMNKDKVVARFDIYFGMLEVYNKLPYDYTDIKDWLELRAKFSCAKDAKEFFKSIGINNTEDYIEVTHCVSLHDTFWVKSEGSRLNWNSVSPFRNNYSDVISTYALEGIHIGNTGKNYFSPVMSTDGSFPHTWKMTEAGIKFIKASSKYTLGGSNSGREPYSEYYASKVAEYLGFKCVEYSIRNHIRHDGKIDVVTECDCYTTEKVGSVSAHTLGLDSYEAVIEYCKNLSSVAYNACVDMFFLDCLLLNTDRHFGNIEFFVDNNTLEILGIVPIFDNNYALLPRFIEGYDTFNRSDYIVRDGRTFDELYQLVKKHKSYQNKLIALKNFRFNKPQNVEISDERLKFLNDLLQIQVKYLLSK